MEPTTLTSALVPRDGPLRIAIIGYSFMGSIHAQAWLTAPRFFDLGAEVSLAVVCGRDLDSANAFAERFGVERVSDDWREVVASPDVDVVDICTPGHLHAEIATAALHAGKHVLCEKPLANSVEQAESMTVAAEAAAARGVCSMVGFSYRRTPALGHAKHMVEAGRVGEIRHIRALYLQDWIIDPNFPLVWRLDASQAGSGALGDLGAHLIDLIRYVTGHQITGVSALVETFVKDRPLPSHSRGLTAQPEGHGAGEERTGSVTVDDAVVVLARTDLGALVTLEATRFATGRKNALRIEVDGSRGSIAFDFERLNELSFYDAELPSEDAGFRRILVTEPGHPFVDAWWPPGHGLGYDHTFVHEVADFARSITTCRPAEPSFRDGLAVQQVLAAVEASAAAQAAWTPVFS